MNVTAHFHEQGSVLRGDAEGFCDRFEIEILIESDEDPQKIADLVRISREGIDGFRTSKSQSKTQSTRILI